MSKQRYVVCVVAACLVAGLATACATKAAAGPCRQRVYDREALLYGGYMRDGFLHLRIAYDFDVEPEHRKAFQGGMALWNAHRDKTGVVFEDATSATIDLRLQRGAPAYVKAERSDGLVEIDKEKIKVAEQAKCAEYVSAGSYIWYSRNIMNELKQATNWLNSDVDDLLVENREFAGLAKIYAHELGHALYLDHNKTTNISLMREGDKAEWCKDLASIIPDIQPDDVRDAQICACRVRSSREPGFVRRP